MAWWSRLAASGRNRLKLVAIGGLLTLLAVGIAREGNYFIRYVVLEAFEVGGPLCGPICGPGGLRHWERPCLGFVCYWPVIDGYVDYCIGVPYGERRCYGYPEQAEEPRGRQELQQMSCPERR